MVPIRAVRRRIAIDTSAAAGAVAAALGRRADVAPAEVEAEEEALETIDDVAAPDQDPAVDRHAPAGDEDHGTGIAWSAATATRSGTVSTNVSAAKRACRTLKRSTSVVTMIRNWTMDLRECSRS